jgi:lactam utilization protein B
MKLINNHMKEVCQMQAWGSGEAPHPPPYMFLTKFSRRSIQQMQEETANIAYQIGRLHHWCNLEDDRHNHNTSKDTMCRTININHGKIKEEGGRK